MNNNRTAKSELNTSAFLIRLFVVLTS